jgi:hypothetical protein
LEMRAPPSSMLAGALPKIGSSTTTSKSSRRASPTSHTVVTTASCEPQLQANKDNTQESPRACPIGQTPATCGPLGPDRGPADASLYGPRRHARHRRDQHAQPRDGAPRMPAHIVRGASRASAASHRPCHTESGPMRPAPQPPRGGRPLPSAAHWRHQQARRSTTAST